MQVICFFSMCSSLPHKMAFFLFLQNNGSNLCFLNNHNLLCKYYAIHYVCASIILAQRLRFYCLGDQVVTLTETLLRIPFSVMGPSLGSKYRSKFSSVGSSLAAGKCAKFICCSRLSVLFYKIPGGFLYASSGQNFRFRVF
jgi:hypothetical protein